jgi:DNA-binding beta-propeller fold protein YncE
MDKKHHRLFVACANKIMAVVNADNGKLVSTFPIGDGPDGAAFDSDRQLAFSPNGGDGTLTVVHEDSPDKFTVLENVATQKGARTLDLHERNHRVFLVTAEFGPTPAATAERPRPRPPMIPGSFTLLVFGK